ncbi:hypothetical protein HDU77_004285, partial [Chytriomyces hyalinus]
ITKKLNPVTRDTQTNKVASLNQAPPYNDALWTQTIASQITQDLRNCFIRNSLSFPDAETFTAADMIQHLANELKHGVSSQQLGYLLDVLGIVSNAVDLDSTVVSDGSVNAAVQEVAEAALELNELDTSHDVKANRRAKLTKAIQSPRRQGPAVKS